MLCAQCYSHEMIKHNDLWRLSGAQRGERAEEEIRLFINSHCTHTFHPLLLLLVVQLIMVHWLYVRTLGGGGGVMWGAINEAKFRAHANDLNKH